MGIGLRLGDGCGGGLQIGLGDVRLCGRDCSRSLRKSKLLPSRLVLTGRGRFAGTLVLANVAGASVDGRRASTDNRGDESNFIKSDCMVDVRVMDGDGSAGRLTSGFACA